MYCTKVARTHNPSASRLIQQALEGKEKDKAFAFRVVLTYYNVWQPPKGPRSEHLKFYENVLFPKVSLEDMCCSMKLRGKDPTDRNKLELVDLLAEDLALEAQVSASSIAFFYVSLTNALECFTVHFGLCQQHSCWELPDRKKSETRK